MTTEKCLASMLPLLLSACAAGPVADAGSDASMQQVELKSSDVMGRVARYDRKTGRCSDGALQLLSATEFEALRDEWLEPENRSACSTSQLQQLPPTAGYPNLFVDLEKSGSAQVLVRLEADGKVASVHAVCASDKAFADAAVATAKGISYSPRECGGRPVRSMFLLPLEYGFE